MEIASGLDEERKSEKVRGPLHGIPIVIKDQWQTSPDYGMPCTAGMAALLEAKNGEPGGLVKKVVNSLQWKCDMLTVSSWKMRV